jgi:hypothetical protein
MFTRAVSVLISLVVCIAASGCSMTLPVRGIVQDSAERFTGTATGYMDSSGNLKIILTNGTSCNGDFVYVTRRTGEGVFECSDGRSGPFRFVSTGRRGNGQGTLGKQTFTFTFGD